MTHNGEPGVSDPSPELVPVIEPGVAAMALPPPAGAGEVAFDGLLSDALFGEVIDISDLIPNMLAPPADIAKPGVPATESVGMMELSSVDGLAVAGHAAALTILYDDGILASDGTI
jgi:hypothetical protein